MKKKNIQVFHSDRTINIRQFTLIECISACGSHSWREACAAQLCGRGRRLQSDASLRTYRAHQATESPPRVKIPPPPPAAAARSDAAAAPPAAAPVLLHCSCCTAIAAGPTSRATAAWSRRGSGHHSHRGRDPVPAATAEVSRTNGLVSAGQRRVNHPPKPWERGAAPAAHLAVYSPAASARKRERERRRLEET